MVTVHDHGSGVPPEFVPDLFERFRGAGTAAAIGRHGSGFGLYIVSRLAQANGCRVGYTAREPHGSSFWLSVPGPASVVNRRCGASPGRGVPPSASRPRGRWPRRWDR